MENKNMSTSRQISSLFTITDETLKLMKLSYVKLIYLLATSRITRIFCSSVYQLLSQQPNSEYYRVPFLDMNPLY